MWRVFDAFFIGFTIGLSTQLWRSTFYIAVLDFKCNNSFPPPVPQLLFQKTLNRWQVFCCRSLHFLVSNKTALSLFLNAANCAVYLAELLFCRTVMDCSAFYLVKFSFSIWIRRTPHFRLSRVSTENRITVREFWANWVRVSTLSRLRTWKTSSWKKLLDRTLPRLDKLGRFG